MWEWERGGISKYQSISWLREIIIKPKQISLSGGPLTQVDPILSLPSCPPGSSSPVHSPNPNRQTVWHIFREQYSPPSSYNTPSPPTFPLPVCQFVCLHCFDSRPRTVRSHAQHCSSINKRLPFSLLHSSLTSVGLKTYRWRCDWQVLMVVLANLFTSCLSLTYVLINLLLTACWVMFCLPLQAPVTGAVSDWGRY